jgi:hypothetical protein
MGMAIFVSHHDVRHGTQTDLNILYPSDLRANECVCIGVRHGTETITSECQPTSYRDSQGISPPYRG